jgi:flagellar motor switch protein FliG
LGIILELDDRAIQKVLREVDALELAKALKGVEEAVKEKIFANISKNAVQMLKKDMESIGPIRIKDVEEAQEKIVNIIRHLEQQGEIVISCSKGDELAI